MITAVSAFATGALNDGSDDAERSDPMEAGVVCEALSEFSVTGMYFQERSSWTVVVVFEMLLKLDLG